ncbi:Mitochondrial 37S ribosomal protein S27 [Candida viswanathii]|uniref:Small ribosomal subunit protein mS33 n=1 Tax=Candida viswanathii TaxID=5486 RepID=A0A367XQZ6_9ASCO|nr:Mitochondrial 37S ribosomal protein S27 [Candida viswanathii]
MSGVLKRFPSKERLLQAKKLTHQIFDELWNPTSKRNPAKILKAPLVGPELVKYYGDNLAVPTFKDFKKWFPELKLVDPREEHRQFMVQDRKRRNKGAPKKKKQ